MITNYLKSSLRHLRKYKSYGIINILGLAIGLSSILFILLYLQYHLNFDQFHQNAKHVYRISVLVQQDGIPEEDSPIFTPPIGPEMMEEFPELENYTRISTPRPAIIGYEQKAFKVKDICYADSTFFDFFSFELLEGNAQNALDRPNSLVLTQSNAERLFGEQSAIGKVVSLDQQNQFIVTGVVADPPTNSHLQFGTLVSFVSLYQDSTLFLDWNGGNQYITYLKLHQHADPDQLMSKFPDFMWPRINNKLVDYGISYTPYLQPFRKIHLYHNPYSQKLRTNLYVFALIGILIILVACINFINLATARATSRIKEIGVRKVLGARLPHLFGQFMIETFVLTSFSFLVAIFLVELTAPLLSPIFDHAINLSNLISPATMGVLLGLLLAITLFSGSYPAFYLSSLPVFNTLKGRVAFGKIKQTDRNGLVVFQFAISAALIVCTLIVTQQLFYIQHKNLGFDKENILILPLTGKNLQKDASLLKVQYLKNTFVSGLSFSSETPGTGFTSNGYVPEGMNAPIMINVVDVDDAFMQQYDLQLLDGRFFSEEQSTDNQGYVINETLAKQLSWETPIGKKINRNGEHRVIGVVKDFHFASLHNQIQPLIITNQPYQGQFDYLSIKLQAGNLGDQMKEVKAGWQQIFPDTPFNYFFLDDEIDQLYRSIANFRILFLCFAGLSIFIALMGIWALASLRVIKRTKEVGIRKILGASSWNILTLLSSDFLRMVCLSLMVAFPIAWWYMHRWLEQFAYQNGISWWIFLVAGLGLLIITFTTVGLKAIQASNVNPVEALRNE